MEKRSFGVISPLAKFSDQGEKERTGQRHRRSVKNMREYWEDRRSDFELRSQNWAEVPSFRTHQSTETLRVTQWWPVAKRSERPWIRVRSPIRRGLENSCLSRLKSGKTEGIDREIVSPCHQKVDLISEICSNKGLRFRGWVNWRLPENWSRQLAED